MSERHAKWIADQVANADPRTIDALAAASGPAVAEQQELATIGELVQIIAEDSVCSDSTERAVKQLDETLERLIDERIAKRLREHSATNIPVQ